MLSKEQFFGMYAKENMPILIIDKTKLFSSVDRQHIYLKDIEKINGRDKIYTEKYNIEYCKLILRPFSAMSEEEMRGCFSKVHDGIIGVSIKNNFFEVALDIPTNISYEIPCDIPFHCIEYLISIGIDIFNLKEKGFAIYKSDL